IVIPQLRNLYNQRSIGQVIWSGIKFKMQRRFVFFAHNPFMFYRYLSVLLLLLFSFVSHAQKRNNIWAFGIKSGLDFNTTPVSGFTSAIEVYQRPYWISSICDRDGKLMFYTDGIKVWNATNDLLPKYKNWWPFTNKVMPLICPYPNNDSLFYLFGIDNGVSKNQLMYLTIRMNKSGDFDELVYPQPVNSTSYFTRLAQNNSIVLAGTAHCNTKDVWITTHEAGAFKSFLVTENGVSSNPVISNISDQVMPKNFLNPGKSNIKFSANGERLVVPLIGGAQVAVFDFDNQSGNFQNPINVSLPSGYTLEDVDLSPDGGMLYVAAYEIVDFETNVEQHYILQFDLNAGSVNAIQQSVFSINGPGDVAACSPRGSCIYVDRTMQLGPDGKIYISMKDYTSTNLDRALSVIEEPNKKGLNARYRHNYVNLGKKYLYINYNYIRSGSFSLKENGIKIQTKTCSDMPVDFGLLFNRVDSVKWDFGDPASGSLNFSTSFKPKHQYPGPGIYKARAIIYNKCLSDTTFKEIVIQQDLSVKIPEGLKDTFFCVGSKLTLDATAAYANTYRWENGLRFPTRVISEPGTYEIIIMNDCSIADTTIKITRDECECQILIPDAFTPNNDGLNDRFKPISKCFATDYLFRIYDRYGGVIFETNQLNVGWNGKSGDKEFPSGNYTWTIQYKNPNTSQLFNKNGVVVLIR
ncbi:MAG: T9SS type B sorting domain-containing protein, partial [Flavisolibacter sp.]